MDNIFNNPSPESGTNQNNQPINNAPSAGTPQINIPQNNIPQNNMGAYPDASQYTGYMPMNNRFGKKSKITVETDRKDYVFLALSAVSAFLLMYFGILGGMKIGFSVTYAVLLTIGLIYTLKKESKNKLFSVVITGFCIVLSASYAITMDYGLQLLSFPILFFMTLVALTAFSGNIRNKDGGYMLITDILESSFANTFLNLPLTFASLGKGEKNGKSKAFFQVIIGLAISLPVLAVIIFLLASSDMAFEGLLNKALSNSIFVLISLVLTVFFTPFLYSCFFQLKKHTAKDCVLEEKSGKIGSAGVNTFLCCISGVYIIYLFSQLAYISDAFSYLLPDDYTAAEFARRGFFEMAAISAINLAVMFLCGAITKHRDDGRFPLATKVLSLFLGLFSVFYIVSAFLRMSQYISRFGLTRLRVLTSVFMLMLLVIFIIMIIRQFVVRLPYIKIILVICGATLSLVSICNINSLISEYNYEAYKSQKLSTVDVDSLTNLGPAAVPQLISLTGDSHKKTSEAACYGLCYVISKYYYENYDLNLLPELIEQKDSDRTLSKWNKCYIDNKKLIDEYFGSLSDKETQEFFGKCKSYSNSSEDIKCY